MSWTPAHIDKITAALGLPVDASGDDVAAAVRICTRRCEELERLVAQFQDSHESLVTIEARLQQLETRALLRDDAPKEP